MLEKEIYEFLTKNGFSCTCADICGWYLIQTRLEDGRERVILPVRFTATSPEEAEKQSDSLRSAIDEITKSSGLHPIAITEDRWNVQREMTQKRLLSHLEVFTPLFARNCEVRRIEKSEASAFLDANHSYGDAACRYRYGMFLKRHTGHRSSVLSSGQAHEADRAEEIRRPEIIQPGALVAVAEFSNARKWQKGDKVIRSYEWIRYASLPDVRINGGMGKMLKHFIKDIDPDDIMSYADLEWSEGSVYEQLGFTLEGNKEAVTFKIDAESGIRRALGKESLSDAQNDRTDAQEILYFRNLGSNKYRLKLTDYQ